MTNFLRGSLLALAASVALGGAAIAGPKCESKAATCAVSAEVGNRAFFSGNRCSIQAAHKAKLALAKHSGGADKSASACSAKASACGASKSCAHKEVGNRGFFTQSTCTKAVKSACCADKAE